MKHKNVLFLLSFLTLILVFSSCSSKDVSVDPPPTPTAPDTAALAKAAFADPLECASCHPNHYSEWETSMHAYAVEDPVFQRLVEISQQRNDKETDQLCITCHSPAAVPLGEAPHDFSFDNLSSVTIRGITCDVCHQMNTATLESGLGLKAKNFHLDRVRRSSISDPMPNNFHESKFDAEFNFSGMCSPCHNIKSPEGDFFLEETNIEWDESPYLAMGLECQDCHMPVYSGEAAIGGPLRDDLNRHYFVGVDYPLIDFPGKAETINMVGDLLKNSLTVSINAPSNALSGETVSVDVNLKNDRTGHNVPSGSIFERQMWVEIVALSLETGDTLFSSGLLDSNKDLRNHHSEDVTLGIVPKDTSLTLFNGIPLDENGDELDFFWEAKSVQKNTIEAFSSHTSRYNFDVLQNSGIIDVKVRVLFRSFPPHFLRKIDRANLVNELIIFEMDDASHLIRVGS